MCCSASTNFAKYYEISAPLQVSCSKPNFDPIFIFFKFNFYVNAENGFIEFKKGVSLNKMLKNFSGKIANKHLSFDSNSDSC
jgi:hypothetical protein